MRRIKEATEVESMVSQNLSYYNLNLGDFISTKGLNCKYPEEKDVTRMTLFDVYRVN